MSKQKKNVYNEFIQEEYVPRPQQRIVRYLAGRGNNLHQVRDHTSAPPFLVSMPKKYRGTLWLKRDDCLVIDPIHEGNKVLGEIVCLMPLGSVGELIRSGGWRPPPIQMQPTQAQNNGSNSSNLHLEVNNLTQERQAGPTSGSSNSSLPLDDRDHLSHSSSEESDSEDSDSEDSEDSEDTNLDHENPQK